MLVSSNLSLAIVCIFLIVFSGKMIIYNVFFRKYPVRRLTTNLNVPYFVKENFHTEYQGSVKRLELSVEEEYVSNLRHACYREKNYSKCFIYFFYHIFFMFFSFVHDLLTFNLFDSTDYEDESYSF